MAHRAVEAQLAQKERVGDLGRRLPRRRQDAHRNRQVIGGALLAQVRRRQVDGEPVLGIEKAAVADGGAHPLGAFAHRRVGQSHQRDLLQPAGNVDFHVNWLRVETDDCAGMHLRKHNALLSGTKEVVCQHSFGCIWRSALGNRRQRAA